MQPWHRWREPLAVVLLVASAVMLVVRAVAFGLAVDTGNAGSIVGSIPGGDELLLVGTAAAVLWCATPLAMPTPGGVASSDGSAGPDHTAPTTAELSPRAWPIAVAGLAVVGFSVLGWFALSVFNVTALLRRPAPDAGFVVLVVEGVIRLAVPVVSLVAVLLAVRRAAATRTAPARGAQRALPAADAAKVDDVPGPPATPERLPAAWQADEATGAVWLSADDAAEGRPGLSWSQPSGPETAQAQGWTPAPGPSSGSQSSTADSSAPAPGRPPPSAALDDDLR